MIACELIRRNKYTAPAILTLQSGPRHRLDKNEMICPKCHKPMDALPGGDAEIIKCGYCFGKWVGGDSLHAFLHDHGDTSDIEAVFEEIMELDFRPGTRGCPQCPKVRLKQVNFDDIELDYCTSCKGMFFDPGELETVFPATRESTTGGEGSGLAENLVDSIRSWLGSDD